MVTALGLLWLLWLFSVLRIGEFWSHRWPRVPQLHHAYYGVLLFAFGWRWTGLVVLADDALQHFLQIWWPTFQSPLHLAGTWLFYKPLYWIRALVAH